MPSCFYGGELLNISGLILVGAGYLLGNPKARNDFGVALQQLIGQSVDALNKMNAPPIYSPKDGGEDNVGQPVEPE